MIKMTRAQARFLWKEIRGKDFFQYIVGGIYGDEELKRLFVPGWSDVKTLDQSVHALGETFLREWADAMNGKHELKPKRKKFDGTL